jgi:hypothetical protein
MQAIQPLALGYLIGAFLMLLCANLLRRAAEKPAPEPPRIRQRRSAAGRPYPHIRRFSLE